MKFLQFLLPACFFLFSNGAFAQLKLNIKPMPTGGGYGVYVKPCDGIQPSANTIAGSGQVTLKVANGNQIAVSSSPGGTWILNSSVAGPMEAPTFSYFSVGFYADVPKLVLQQEEETLLFTVSVSGSGVPTLIDNENDPFNQQPNSAQSNPGNDLTIMDVGVSPIGQYSYSGHYSDNDPNSCTEEPETTPVFEQFENGHFFAISPNPVSQLLNVRFFSLEQPSVLKIWSATGQLVERQPVEKPSDLRLQVGQLPDGLYLMGLETEGRLVQREKFLKQ